MDPVRFHPAAPPDTVSDLAGHATARPDPVVPDDLAAQQPVVLVVPDGPVAVVPVDPDRFASAGTVGLPGLVVPAPADRATWQLQRRAKDQQRLNSVPSLFSPVDSYGRIVSSTDALSGGISINNI